MRKSFVFIIFLILASKPLAAQPVITSLTTNLFVLNGSNTAFNVAASGIGPLTYQWRLNGSNLPNNIITSVAGNSNSISGFSGDGGAATNAKLESPDGVTVDQYGDFFIADTDNDRIRKVNASGIITTIAGSANPALADGLAATNARLNHPNGLLIDAMGRIFIADTSNARIRMIDTNGLITTIAGNGSINFSGDGGAATNATLATPTAVAADSYGALYIADGQNSRVRRVSTNGVITTFAGTNFGFVGDGHAATNTRLFLPFGVCVDVAGNLLIADRSNNRIRKVDTNGIITTIVGNGGASFSGDGGAAVLADLPAPSAVSMDRYGYLFICDDQHVRMVDLQGSISTVAGGGGSLGDGGPATNAFLSLPGGVAPESSGTLLVADPNHNLIRRVTLGRLSPLSLNIVTTNNAGNYDVIVSNPSGSVTSSVVTLSVVFKPGIVVQPQDVLVTNGSPASFLIGASGTSPYGYQWYAYPNALIDGETNSSLNFASATTNQAGHYFCVVTTDYGSVTGRTASLTVVLLPSIASQPTSQVIIKGNNAIFSVVPSGTGPFHYQWQMNGNNLPDNMIITTIAGNGTNGFSGEGGWGTNASINPTSVAVDAVGNVFIGGNNRVWELDTNGIITTVAGNGTSLFSGDGGVATNAGISSITGVSVDLYNNLYIADGLAGRVRKVGTNGIINTVAGKNHGFSGDGGAATNAQLSFLQGVVVDPLGNLFVGDWGNSRIRKVDINGNISTLATSIPCYGIAVDAFDNVYVAEEAPLVKIDTNGVVTLVAGNQGGQTSFFGDGGPATNAGLRAVGVAKDVFGNVFIADDVNNRIRKVDANGIITTVAGVGSGGSGGYSGDGGVATNAHLWLTYPTGVAVDGAGNIFIADNNNRRVRKVGLAGSPQLTLYQVNEKNAIISYGHAASNTVSLKLDASNQTNIGNFSVVVSSPYGSVTSSIASLGILYPPSITTQPANVATTNGGLAAFSTVVSGDAPLNYQWFTSSGRTATAVPRMNFVQFVQSAIITGGGTGYTSVPAVQFTGGGGFWAGGTTVISNDTVIGINITNSGFSYTSPPSILIDNPSPVFVQSLPDRTNSTLTIPSVSLADVTNYFVVITNNWGSVTSAMAGLAMFIPPQGFGGLSTNGRQLNFQLTGTPGYPYSLQTATNLTPPINWKSIVTNLADTNGVWNYSVTNLTNMPGLFYRAVGQ